MGFPLEGFQRFALPVGEQFQVLRVHHEEAVRYTTNLFVNISLHFQITISCLSFDILDILDFKMTPFLFLVTPLDRDNQPDRFQKNIFMFAKRKR
jgi:hypothetical protein